MYLESFLLLSTEISLKGDLLQQKVRTYNNVILNENLYMNAIIDFQVRKEASLIEVWVELVTNAPFDNIPIDSKNVSFSV